jgi:hypothetical protein
MNSNMGDQDIKLEKKNSKVKYTTSNIIKQEMLNFQFHEDVYDESFT